MSISRRDAFRVAADVLERSEWLTVDLLADEEDENASENAARIVEILREEAAEDDPIETPLEACSAELAEVTRQRDEALFRLRERDNATAPPPSGAAGATTHEALADAYRFVEAARRGYAAMGVAGPDVDIYGIARSLKITPPPSAATGAPTPERFDAAAWIAGAYPNGVEIRYEKDTLPKATVRTETEIPWRAPGDNGGPTLAPPLADFGITRTGDVVGVYDASGEVREEFRPRRTSGPLDPEIHAALVRAVERGRREQRGCGIPECYCPGDVSHP